MKNHEEKPIIACTTDYCARPEVNIDDQLAAIKAGKEVARPTDPQNNELVTKPRP
jgi:hypothetical protein